MRAVMLIGTHTCTCIQTHTHIDTQTQTQTQSACVSHMSALDRVA
jgi:hypothetical protein